MGEHEKDLVVEEITENVDAVPTEEITGEGDRVADPSTEKVYTEAELNQRVDELLGKKIARREAKIRKEYEQKYGEMETVLKAGTGLNDVSEVTKKFRQYYEGKGLQIPSAAPEFSTKDIETLANAEADDIIREGLDEVIEEVDRLAGKGVANMSAREKALFKNLAEYRKVAETNRELEKIGVTKDIYESKDFKEFASKFDSKTPVTEIYGIYEKMKPKKEVETMGSMKSTTSEETGVKDFYTYEESLKYTKEDYDKNPKLWNAMLKSMTQWGKRK